MPLDGDDRRPVAVSGLAASRFALDFLRDPLNAARAMTRRHGPFVELTRLVPFGLSRQTFLLAIGAGFNRAVLGSPAEWRPVRLVPGGPRNSAMRRLAHGIFRMVGEQHAHYRRLLLPPLRRTAVEAMGPAMIGLAEEEIAGWRPDRPVDLWADVRQLMRGFAIGLLFGDDRTRGFPIADMIGQVLKLNWSLHVAACPVNLPFTPYGRMLGLGERLEPKIVEWAGCKRGRPDPGDLLSILANGPDETGKPTSDAVLVGHLPSLFAAAYETCQNVLIWTLVLVSLHPEVARDLHAELEGALGDGPASFEAIAALPLLDAVVKESLRMMPPVPVQQRVALADTSLLGHPVRRGTRVVLSSFLTGRDPALYPDPDCFRPARWAGIDPSAYENPVFSAGPRTCPGATFGNSVVKVGAATLLRRWRVAIPAGSRIDFKVRLTLNPRDAVPAVLRPVDGDWRSGPVTGSLNRLVRLPG
ncbi:MAG: cytochrome P450 [Dongiaceae bacterium]